MSTKNRLTGNKNPFFTFPSLPVLDYTAVMDALKDYKRPRDKVTTLLRNGILIRVKKGLYILNSDDLSNIPIKEVLANLIYGPSYISLQYALYKHGLIPEYAIHVSSVTFKKTKKYHTPVGDFMYRSVPKSYYVRGVVLRTNEPDMSYLIASPEKAIMDICYFTTYLRTTRDVRNLLFKDIRIDKSDIRNLDFDMLTSIVEVSGSKKLRLCKEAIETV